MHDDDILIRQWLWRYYDAKQDVFRLEQEYKELVAIQESAGAVGYDGMPAKSNEISDLSGLIIARDEAVTRLLQAKSRQATTYCEITKAISQLDFSIERNIISMRYLRFICIRKTDWDDIADTLGFSPSHIKHVHGLAIQKLIRIVGTKTLHEFARNSTKKH